MSKLYTNNFRSYLFANPSFFRGMARVLDLGGTLQIYNKYETANEADYAAILSDWQVIGNDIKISIQNYEKKTKKIASKKKK